MHHHTLMTPLLAAIILCCACPALPNGARTTAGDTVRVRQTARILVIENRLVKLSYSLDAGTYDVLDKQSATNAIAGAKTEVNGLTPTGPGWKRSWTSREVSDRLGKGRAVTVTSADENQPSLLFEATLYENKGFVVLGAGLRNTTGQPVRVHELSPLTGAAGYPAIRNKQDAVTLNGASGAAESFVLGGFDRQSENNLLVTFAAAGNRKSMVWGGLAYREFAKYASAGNVQAMDAEREAQIAAQAPGGFGLVGYLRAWTGRWLDVSYGRMIRRENGCPYQFAGAAESAEPWYATTSAAADSIRIWVAGLKKERSYAIGFSWWDFDGRGRRQSVVAKAGGKEYTLAPARPLPDFARTGAGPEETVLALPNEACSAGHAVISFLKEPGAPDAVLGEFWVYESDEGSAPDLSQTRGVRSARSPIAANDLVDIAMKASDPRGKLVDPGGSCGLEEQFYLDFSVGNPFDALERYGLAVRAANAARPNIYSFPTVCGWYASGSYPGCPYVNHTRGMVEEAEWAEQTGFTRYSPAAVRVVPDVVGAQSEQGWWDDEHWRRHGHYVEPYETTEKFCAAVAARGCLPFTYVHTCLPNQDFLGKHPHWALGYDPQDGVYRNTGYDYSNPGFQAHMRRVWGTLRAGGIKGVMFDYPGSGWQSAGFSDPYYTTGSFYRTIFDLCKKGLGPDSYVHERLIGQYGQPQTDITAGIVDSQRTEWDTQMATPEMYTKCGLRWYKNRVIFTYDMDAKNFLNVSPANRDGLRQVLTMAYIVAPRLLLGTSFRSMKPDEVHDLTRIYPIHSAPKSARPLDVFTSRPYPRVYDFRIDDRWHQVAFYNHDVEKEAVIGAEIGEDSSVGGMDLNPARRYYVYDFWNDRFVGLLSGTGRLEQTLRPGEVRMMSVHEAADHPQFVSTNRHVMQGYLDLKRIAWDPVARQLSGTSEVVAGETYKVVIACNGYVPRTCSAQKAQCRLETPGGGQGLVVLCIDSVQTASVNWSVEFADVPPGSAARRPGFASNAGTRLR